jgi:hypothetical protein
MTTEGLHVDTWTRRRDNHWLYAQCVEPLAVLYGTEHDAWKTGEYLPDATWDAAVLEFNARYDRYMRLLPPISVSSSRKDRTNG